MLLTKGHDNEYPTMHYFEIPETYPVNDSIKDFDSVFLEIPAKNCIDWNE